MTTNHTSLLPVGVFLTALALVGCRVDASTADFQAHVPQTPAARDSSALLARAERAVRGYVGACTTGDARALSEVTTSDVRIEYMLREPGTYLRLDPDSLLAECAALAKTSTPRPDVTDLWLFPTNDANAVFVEYFVGSERELALIELSGDRIAKVLDFTSRQYQGDNHEDLRAEHSPSSAAGRQPRCALDESCGH